jgi:hypothetical protein|tara:strand:+ start:207 stop:395 length:189 start_codon:yes stop_codon:yes gene_type:complete
MNENINNLKDMLQQLQNMKETNGSKKPTNAIAKILGFFVSSFLFFGWATFSVVMVLRWLNVI